jgi:hemolysin activation/secretion protein
MAVVSVKRFVGLSNKFLIGLVSVLLISANPGFVRSQISSGSTAPGRVEQELRREPQPLKGESINIDRARFPDQLPAGADAALFTLSRVEIRGNQALGQAQLSSLWEGALGKQITLADAFGIASAVSARYRESGFVLSQAFIPQQDLATAAATLRIEVLEGFVDKVSFSGVPSLHAKLAPFLMPIRNEKPLTTKTLERYLLLLNEIGGISAKANLKAGSVANASDLEVILTQSSTGFSGNLHNRVSDAQGPQRLEAGVDFNGGLSGLERHNFRLFTSGTQQINLLSYSGDIPLGNDGLKATWSLSNSLSRPKNPLGTDLENASTNFSVGVSYPLVRSRQFNVGIRGGLSGYNNSSELAGIQSSKDQVRAVWLGSSVDYADAINGVNLLDVEFSKGLSGMGASAQGNTLLSRQDGNPQFTKATIYLARLQSLGGPWSMLLAANAQSTSDRLLSAEQFGLGGELFLRAFDPSEVVGDSGSAGKLELRYGANFAALSSTFYTYFDSGQTVRDDPTGKVKTSLTAYGLGIRFSSPNRLKGFLEVAKPNKKNAISTGNQKPRLFAGIGFDY